MNNFINKLYIKGLMAKQKLMSQRGEANIIAIILVLAIVIALAIVFKNKLTDLFNQIWEGLTGDVTKISGGGGATLPAGE